jgi:hypothetical protein
MAVTGTVSLQLTRRRSCRASPSTLKNRLSSIYGSRAELKRTSSIFNEPGTRCTHPARCRRTVIGWPETATNIPDGGRRWPTVCRSVVYDRIVPQPPAYPPQVHRWVNIADRNDLIAARPDLNPMFGAPPAGVVFDGGWTVHNGAKPHQAEFYLTKEQTGRPIGEVLYGQQLRHEPSAG